MEIKGSNFIPAPREDVWTALNDAEILCRCIPGCESLTWVDDHTLDGRVMAKVGPVRARFNGRVTLSNLDPPQGYTLSGEGAGGAAGFAKGGADVRLVPVEGGTNLEYTARADVGGKLAQVGARLIESVAHKMAADFFGRFAAELTPAAPEAGEAGEAGGAGEPAAPAPAEPKTKFPAWGWAVLGAAVAAAAAAALYGGR